MRYLSCNFVRKKILEQTFSPKFSKFNIKTWSIVFFGSDYYSLYSLKALHSQMKERNISQMEVVLVNEKSPVYEYSVSNDIKTHFWPPKLNGSYDFGVIVSFGKLIQRDIIEKFQLGIINVHGSLLPKYRGGMPIVHAVKNGDPVTGITVSKIKVDEFDVGDIILQKTCAIGKNEYMPSLYKRMMHLGCECLLEVISKMPKCLDQGLPQQDEDASYAPKLKKEDALIKWSEMTALEIYNLHRALFNIFELATSWNGKPVKLVCMFFSDSKMCFLTDEDGTKREPGCFSYNKRTKFLNVQCKDSILTVCSLKYSNRLHTASSFYTGFLHKIPKTLWKFKS